MTADLIRTQSPDWLCGTWKMATPRTYTLTEDWQFELRHYPLCCDPLVAPDKIVIQVPAGFKFNGASVPLPWLTACLSLGVLRPMGILFTASIVHDYAYQHGKLALLTDNTLTEHVISRSEADKLFRDTIKTVNRAPIAAWLAWTGVWLGGWANWRGLPSDIHQ